MIVDRIGLEVAESTDAHPGAGEHVDTQATMQRGFIGEGSHELGVVAVVKEIQQGLVAFGDVTEEDRHPR